MWSGREFRFNQFRRQMFERGDLKYVILEQLKDKPAHQDGRKVYSITDAGRSFMNERQPQVDEVFNRMKERWGAEWGPQAQRLMHDLRNDMRDLGRSVASEARNRWPDPEQQRRIRDVIGRAKTEIQSILSEQRAKV